MRSLLLFFVALAGSATVFADTPAPTVLAGVNGSRLRIEALDDGLVRIWRKAADADFTREPSLATADAPVVRRPVRVNETADGIVAETEALRIVVDPRTLAFDVLDRKDGTPLLARVETLPTASGAWTLSHVIAADERLLGLGEDNRNGGRLDRRGTIRELWAGQQIRSGDVTANHPVPLLLSTGPGGHAYGVFFDTTYRLRFDLGRTQADHVRVQADGGEIDLYVIDGPRLADVIERYTRLTGRPSLPPLWALGYWQSRCTYRDWHELDRAYDELTARGFPVDVMVIDADWPEVVTDYTWARRWVESAAPLDPAGKIAEYARKGVRIVLSQSGPMVRQDAPTFASGWKAGVFATDAGGNPVECGYYGGKLLDFTHPHLNRWLWPQTRRLNEQGIAGWWLDLVEPEGEPPETRYFAGTPANVHNQFALLCAQSFEGVQLAVHPAQRPFLLSRVGPAGIQRHHAAVWTGDIHSDYATLRAHPPEMLNSGLSGLAYWTCDTGGFLSGYYRDEPFGAHALLYERWMQFSALAPITRAHKAGGTPEPYQFGPAVEQSARHYLQLRYRLLPYLYSYAWQASRTGLPLVRPLLLEYPDDRGAGEAAPDQYLLGSELLVAPVLVEGQSRRRVYFPPGKWVDWDYGFSYPGAREWVVEAPQNRIPLAVRAGAILPLAPVMRNSTQGAWDPLTFEVFPSGRSEFTLYQDDGTTFGYTRGEFTTTRLTSELDERRVTFRIQPSNARFVPQTYLIRLHLDRAPEQVTIDGATAVREAWRWDPGDRVLTITVRAGDRLEHVIAATLSDPPLPERTAPELEPEAVDPGTETVGTGGKSSPHLLPAPALPVIVHAANYDRGGEGVAFHSAAPRPPDRIQRDPFAVVPAPDPGAGPVLACARAEEWFRYTVNAGGGGYFDLNVRAAAGRSGGRFRLFALDRVVAEVSVPAGADTVWHDVEVPRLYLHPGEVTLTLFVDRPGFRVDQLDFERPAQSPRRYPAAFAARAGSAEPEPGGEAGTGAVRGLGRIGTRLTWGVVAPRDGAATLRLHYQNLTGRPLPYALKVGEHGAPRTLLLPPTRDTWSDFDLDVVLRAGAQSVTLSGQVDGWDGITLEWLELRD